MITSQRPYWMRTTAHIPFSRIQNKFRKLSSSCYDVMLKRISYLRSQYQYRIFMVKRLLTCLALRLRITKQFLSRDLILECPSWTLGVSHSWIIEWARKQSISIVRFPSIFGKWDFRKVEFSNDSFELPRNHPFYLQVENSPFTAFYRVTLGFAILVKYNIAARIVLLQKHPKKLKDGRVFNQFVTL